MLLAIRTRVVNYYDIRQRADLFYTPVVSILVVGVALRCDDLGCQQDEIFGGRPFCLFETSQLIISDCFLNDVIRRITVVLTVILCIMTTDTRATLMPATHAQETCTMQKLVPETCTRNLHEKFDASPSQFLAPKQISSQSRCTVRVTCQTVSVLEME